jgi:hypothetical protein
MYYITRFLRCLERGNGVQLQVVCQKEREIHILYF